MGRDDKRPWDESQVEAPEVGDNLVIERTSTSAQPKTRRRFPSRFEGRDGDSVTVRMGSDTYDCRKVLGRWVRTRLGGS